MSQNIHYVRDCFSSSSFAMTFHITSHRERSDAIFFYEAETFTMSAIASKLRFSQWLYNYLSMTFLLPVIANEVTRSFSMKTKHLLCQRLHQFFELRNDFSFNIPFHFCN